MIVFPNAKINIGLNIVEKRVDGYHNIETIFFPIGLSDVLEINLGKEESTFSNTGIIIEQGNEVNNLCTKALNLLSQNYSIKPVNIHLHKIIPIGAGLGGGSSDGSFTLKTINSLQNLNIDEPELLNFASKLGSDCPFFIYNKPVFAKGTGNIFESVEINLKGYFLVLISPGIHVNTAKAYSKSIPKMPEKSLKDIISKPVELWKDFVFNDFEPIVFKEYPQIERIKKTLYNSGAVYASMSGSGSSVFGLFKTNPLLKEIFGDQFIWQQKL